MCNIYAQSYLTIAATHSKNPFGGCFRTSYVRAGQTYTFHRGKTGPKYQVHTRETLPHINDFEIGNKEEIHFPLLNRAWVFQERVLSPRTLHFGPQELLWECKQTKACECSNWPGYTSKLRNVRLEWLHMTMDSPPVQYAGKAIASPAEWKWRRIVEQYTSNTLTKDSDIFPALQGVARSIGPGSRYRAGIWADDSLLQALLWHVRVNVRWDLTSGATTSLRLANTKIPRSTGAFDRKSGERPPGLGPQ